LHSVFAIALLFTCSGAALSQNYPAKRVRIMVGYTPGGGVDTTARTVSQALGELWGVPNVFMVHPSMPAKTLRQYIAYAKANLGKVNFGSSGVGASPHLSIELLKTITGINIVHVPYKGAGGALTDLISGHIESSVGNLAGAPLAAVKSGRVRALRVTSARRNAQLPEVPTFTEGGVPGYDVTGWYGICTQSKVPQPILAKLTADLHKVLAGPLKKRLEDEGIDVTPSTPEQFAAHAKSEIEKWTKVVIAAKLEAD
jgi:tripartite-type tricarboxylate transporter receptor subunit TctC